VDVGARYDVDYVDISKGNQISYYLFEANPKFYEKLTLKLKGFEEAIVAENLAVGEKETNVDYFEDSESILKNTTAVKNSKHKLGTSLKMIRLDRYFSNTPVKEIDFLKIDIEEYDYFALLGLGDLLKKCRFIQFELGIGAPFENGNVSNSHYYDLLEGDFDLYLVKDENNPLWIKKVVESDLVPINALTKKVILEAQEVGYGFNVFCVNKRMPAKVETLTKTSLPESALNGLVFY